MWKEMIKSFIVFQTYINKEWQFRKITEKLGFIKLKKEFLLSSLGRLFSPENPDFDYKGGNPELWDSLYAEWHKHCIAPKLTF